MKGMKVSIIVPAFNSEHTIKKCLESICSSTYSNIEVIVIDDASTDTTFSIVRECQEKYQNIQAYSIENAGPGMARNEGLKYVSGVYFMFIDSDDFIEPKAIEQLVEIAEQQDADIVCGTYKRVTKDKIERIELPVTTGFVRKNGSKEEAKRYHQLKVSNAFGYLWNKLHRTSFFREHHLFLPTDRMINLEDNLFYLKVFSKHPRFYVSDVVVANYNVETPSLTRQCDYDYWKKSLGAIAYGYQYLNNENIFLQELELFLPMVMRLYCFSLVRNGAYEPITMKGVEEITQHFLEDEAFFHCIHATNSDEAIKTIPSFLQRLVFGYCLHVLQKGKQKRFLRIIVLAYPLIRVYLKKILR